MDAWSTWDPSTAQAHQDSRARVLVDERGLMPDGTFIVFIVAGTCTLVSLPRGIPGKGSQASKTSLVRQRPGPAGEGT